MRYDAYRKIATLWANRVPDGTGDYTFDAPRQIEVVWQNNVQQFSSPTGEILMSRSQVFVKEDIHVGDWLFEGVSTATNPRTVDGAFEVKGFRKTPDLRYSQSERKAFL